MTYGKGSRVTNPPKRIGGDSQGRGSTLNDTYYTTESTRWGDKIVPKTSDWTVTTTPGRWGDNVHFSPKPQPVQQSGGVSSNVTPVQQASAPPPEQKKALLIHPLQDEVDKLKILSSLRARFGGMGTAKSNNLPFKQRDNFIPMNIEGSVGLNIA